MAEIEKVEFEFPDEKEAKESAAPQQEPVVEKEAKAEPDIEIVDDTPEKDRGRKPLEAAPEDPTEDELSQYSESVKQRIQKFTKGYHDERRRSEAALREKEEALRLAQSIVEENKRLKGSLTKGQEALINQAKQTVGMELEQAKRKYKEAYDSGDSDALVDAQENLTAAKIKADKIANFKPSLQSVEKSVEQQQVVQAPRPDDKALAWQSQNRWFGDDEEMTSFALGLHQKLVRSGVDPQSGEYYERIDSRMRQVFPDAFDTPEEEPEKVEKPTRAKASVVAPATRSTASKKIVLTQTQVNIAKRLGVPLELYAKKVAEEARK
jgi:hypothetical protein